LFPVIIFSRKCLAQNLMFSCNLHGGHSLILAVPLKTCNVQTMSQSKLEYSITVKSVCLLHLQRISSSLVASLHSLFCQVLAVVRQGNKFWCSRSIGGHRSQQPASLCNSSQQVLNFLDVAIAACCHTAASGGCAQATRRISACWCTCLEATGVNN
jgi:hypothetical protein